LEDLIEKRKDLEIICKNKTTVLTTLRTENKAAFLKFGNYMELFQFLYDM